MRPVFTIHAGELSVGQYIEQNFKGKNIWVPAKDLGIDLLVTNSNNSRTVSLQVKFSTDYLPTMMMKLGLPYHSEPKNIRLVRGKKKSISRAQGRTLGLRPLGRRAAFR